MMLVSVLLPTRNRLAGLRDTVESFNLTISDRSRAEILVKVDSDDEQTLIEAQRLQRESNIEVRTVVSDRGRGYLELHRFYNELASVAKGRWLWLFNDDCQVKSFGWDNHVASLDPVKDIAIVTQTVDNWVTPERHEPGLDSTFPLITRKLFEVLGHISLNAHNDSYLGTLKDGVGGINIDLHQIELQHNAWKYVTSDPPPYHISSPSFYEAGVQQSIKDDIMKLKQYLNS